MAGDTGGAWRQDGIQPERDPVLCRSDVEHPRVFEVDLGEVRKRVLVLHGQEYDGPSAVICRDPLVRMGRGASGGRDDWNPSWTARVPIL